jgi:flagellar FliL protein
MIPLVPIRVLSRRGYVAHIERLAANRGGSMADNAAGPSDQGTGRKKLILMAALVVAIAGAGYWFLIRTPPQTSPEAGEVVVLEPIQLNLAGGRYLRVAMALQATTDVEEDIDGSRALDAAIDVFSGLPLEEVAEPGSRASLKEELRERVMDLYEGELMDIYFTEFVTQ